MKLVLTKADEDQCAAAKLAQIGTRLEAMQVAMASEPVLAQRHDLAAAKLGSAGAVGRPVGTNSASQQAGLETAAVRSARGFLRSPACHDHSDGTRALPAGPACNRWPRTPRGRHPRCPHKSRVSRRPPARHRPTARPTPCVESARRSRCCVPIRLPARNGGKGEHMASAQPEPTTSATSDPREGR